MQFNPILSCQPEQLLAHLRMATFASDEEDTVSRNFMQNKTKQNKTPVQEYWRVLGPVKNIVFAHPALKAVYEGGKDCMQKAGSGQGDAYSYLFKKQASTARSKDEMRLP